MRRVVFVFALFVATPAFAQEEHPALFVARDADSTMYLFGTVHVLRPGADWGGPKTEAALAQAEEVWTEVEMSGDMRAEARGLIARYGMAPEGRGLSTWLSAEENARLSALATRLRVPAGMLEPMQPWFASLTLSVLPMMQAGYDPEAGVDQSIDTIAGAQGKSMRAFETMEQQIAFLANVSDEAQRQMLLDTIEQSEGGAEQLDVLAAAWARGDVDALEALVVDETRTAYPELYEVMLKRRNDAWMVTLLSELEGAGVDFVAVGAGHIVGEAGLVAQLRARGVIVERVE